MYHTGTVDMRIICYELFYNTYGFTGAGPETINSPGQDNKKHGSGISEECTFNSDN